MKSYIQANTIINLTGFNRTFIIDTRLVDHQKKYDIIIAGAGAAGLSVLWRILDSTFLTHQKILLIDKTFEPTDDKTWCFWESLELPSADLLFHSWDRLKVRINGNTYMGKLDQYKYQCLKSHHFVQSILQKARESNRVTFCEAEIHGFSNSNDLGIVHTSVGMFNSPHIFQSVLHPPGFKEQQTDVSLIQHFLGWEIETNKEIFAPEYPKFMDFEVPQKNGLTFVYLLPYSENRALVEYTLFSKKLLSKKEYAEGISNYLKETYNLHETDYSISRKEFGTIPMDDRKYFPWYCDYVMNIGTVGGMAKPSTGYTFSRIQKHSEMIVKALENRENIPGETISPYRFRVYDLMILYLLANEPGNALHAFERLFKKNSFDRVLQFLAEQTNPLQEFSIILKMPPLPFLRSIYKLKHRIFTGE